MFHKHKRYLSQVIDGGIILEEKFRNTTGSPFLMFLGEK